MFTQSPRLISLCNRLSIEVVKRFERNLYGLPLLRDMIQQGKRLYVADNYGYLNSDILFSPKLFEALMTVRSNVKQKVISSTVRNRAYFCHSIVLLDEYLMCI